MELIPHPRLATQHRARLFAALIDRAGVTGTLSFRAVPSAAEAYAERLLSLFQVLGKPFRLAEAERLRGSVADLLNDAQELDPNAMLVCRYNAQLDKDIRYDLSIEPRTTAERYAHSHKAEPHFGARPDARVLDLVEHSPPLSVLDLGAGTGRNTAALALLGHRVVAVELVPKFVEQLRETVCKAGVEERVRVVEGDMLAEPTIDACGVHDLVIASQVVPHLADEARLRRFFTSVSAMLRPEGRLLLNGFLPDPDCVLDSALREASAVAWSTIFAKSEYIEAAKDFTLLEVTEALEYERTRADPVRWPPTPWFEGWSRAGDVFNGPGPARLHWLVFEKKR